MKLEIVPRAINKKSEINKLRREGFIPVVLYVRGKEGETFAIKSSAYTALLKNVKPGHLPTTIFTLVDEKGKERRAVVKEIQYKVTTYEVIHLDFEELLDDQKINIKVPIECVGAAECAGIKLGGVLRQTIRHAPVSCYPKDIPAFLELDVRSLAVKQSKRLSDVVMPNEVRPLLGLNEVVAVIVKR